MILNSEGLAVWECESIKYSLCPECGSELTAVRPAERIWHWRHQAESRVCSVAARGESEWHQTWKYAYARLDGWQQEVAVLDGAYRLDCAKLERQEVREFIHSLDDRYTAKDQALSEAGFNTVWIVNGDKHASPRRRLTEKNNMYRLLSPRAYDCVSGLGRVWCHFEGGLWQLIYRESATNHYWKPIGDAWLFDRASAELTAIRNGLALKEVA